MAGALSLVIGLGAAPASGDCPRPGESWLAIVVDDLGYSLERGSDIVEIPAPLTLSIIPGTPHAKELAALGTQWNKELMVHMPMSAAQAQVTDPMVLTEDLTDEDFDALLARAVASVPGARGLNNHMGSSLTQRTDRMHRLMEWLKKASLYFIDSRTTADTVAATAAANAALPHASRSVFLDHERGADAVARRLNIAVNVARDTGTAIAIGHPHRETVRVLNEALPSLPSDVTLVPASRVAGCANAQRLTSIPRDAM